jgi:hypothetical protein
MFLVYMAVKANEHGYGLKKSQVNQSPYQPPYMILLEKAPLSRVSESTCCI